MELIEELRKYDYISVAGAGIKAEQAYYVLRLKYNLDVLCAVVSNTDDNPVSIADIPVVSIETLAKEDANIGIVICVRGERARSFEKVLKKKGLNNTYLMDESWEEEYKELSLKGTHLYSNNYEINYFIKQNKNVINEANKKLRVELFKQRKERMEGLFIIPRLVVVLGTKCTLRCRDCNNLIPYFDRPCDFPVEEIIHSLSVLLSNVKKIKIVELIGGEPFVSNNLQEVIEFLKKEDKVDKIEITTNGTVTPTEDVLSSLKDEKIVVRLSDYGELVNNDKIIEALNNNSIAFEIMGIEKWLDSGTTDKRNRSIEELKRIYQRCDSQYICKTLFRDKFFSCARAASCYSLGYMKEDDYLLVDDGLNTKQIMDFLLKDFSYACDYCDHVTKEGRMIEPAIQL